MFQSNSDHDLKLDIIRVFGRTGSLKGSGSPAAMGGCASVHFIRFQAIRPNPAVQGISDSARLRTTGRSLSERTRDK